MTSFVSPPAKKKKRQLVLLFRNAHSTSAQLFHSGIANCKLACTLPSSICSGLFGLDQHWKATENVPACNGVIGHWVAGELRLLIRGDNTTLHLWSWIGYGPWATIHLHRQWTEKGRELPVGRVGLKIERGFGLTYCLRFICWFSYFTYTCTYTSSTSYAVYLSHRLLLYRRI